MTYKRKRQVIWNSVRSNQNLNYMTWYFLIVNENNEIKRIENNIIMVFAPLEEQYNIIEGKAGEGLRYKLLCFDSNKKIEIHEIKKIYKNILKDSKLHHKSKTGGLENYIIGQFS